MAQWVKNANGSYWNIGTIEQVFVKQWSTTEDPAGDNQWYIWAQYNGGTIIRFADGGVNLGPFATVGAAQSKLDSGIANLGGAIT
jgi:hypothetical protein